MNASTVECPKCNHTFKIKCALRPKSLQCPACKVRFAPPDDTPIQQSVQEQPVPPAKCTATAPHDPKHDARPPILVWMLAGGASIVALGIAAHHYWTDGYIRSIPLLFESIRDQIVFDGRADFAIATAILFALVIFGSHVAVCHTRAKAGLILLWLGTALTVYYIMTLGALRICTGSGGRSYVFPLYHFETPVPYLVLGIAILCVVHALLATKHVIMRGTADSRVSPLPLVFVLSFMALGAAVADGFLRPRWGYGFRDMMIRISVFYAVAAVGMLTWLVWHAMRRIEGKVERLALWSISLASGSIVLSVLSAVPAVVCGHLALRRIGKTGLQGRGFAIAGICIGYFFILAFGAAVLLPIILR